LVEPPVARRPATPLTTLFSSTTEANGVAALPFSPISTTRFGAAAVSASRSGVLGCTNAAPGRCRPIISIIIWLELAVP
jgi:hypothetical protein